MKTVDSQALGIVTRALGMTGAGAPLTEFLDGELLQTLDVGQLVRRGRTLAGSSGIFMGAMRNNHAGADSQSSVISPYNVPTGAIAPYPAVMPRGFDIWLLAAQAEQISGTGTFSGALFVTMRGQQGFGIDQAGAAVVRDSVMLLAFWDSVVTEAREFGLLGGQFPFQAINLRLPRSTAAAPGTELTWATTSSAAAVFDVQLVLGVFPISLGQDATV